MTATEHSFDRQRELDWLMLAVVCLSCIGIVMAVSVQSLQDGGGALLAMKSQGAKLVAGLVAFFFCALVPLRKVERAAVPLFAAGAGLVFFAALFGPPWNGARRWISIAGHSFQPVEFARLTLVIVTAALIARVGRQIASFRAGFVTVMAPALVLAFGLFLQPDHGNALMGLAIAVSMGLAAGVAARWFAFAIAPMAPVVALFLALNPYALKRVLDYFSGEKPYQVKQSLLAIQSGGFAGSGIGHGWWKLGFVPEAHNDFVFAIVGEELGFLGTVSVLGLYTLIGVVGYRLVLQIRDTFCRYVVFGCSMAICIQALINVLVTTGMAPAKGIDLPLVSSGGTNLMASLGAVGLIGNATRTDLASRGT